MEENSKNDIRLSAKQRIGDSANAWLSKNRSLVLRQTPKWAQGMTTIIASLGLIVVAGSIVFKIDEVITVTGQLKSIGGNTQVKTPASGKVEKVYVADGDLVQKGSLIISFDTREALEDQKTMTKLLKLEEEKFLSQSSQFESSLSTLSRNRDVLEQRLKTKSYMLDEISKLVDVGGFQKLQYLQQKDSVFELRTQLNELDEQTNMLTISFNQIKIEYQKRKDQLVNQLKDVEVKLQYQKVQAPISGIVFDSKVYPGSVLQPGQPILSIVPQIGLDAQVYIPNKDIGLVKSGQSVKVRVDAFPYARYGEIAGKIINIGADALPPTETLPFFHFPVKLKLDRPYLLKDDIKIPLMSGMSISTNIKLREKRVISLVSDVFVNQTDSLETLRQQ